MSFFSVASLGQSDTHDLLYSMRDLLDKNTFKFITEFADLEDEKRQQVVDDLIANKIAIKEFVRCFKAVHRTEWTFEKKQGVMSAFFLALSPDDRTRFVQSHLDRTVEDMNEFCNDLLLINDPKSYVDILLNCKEINNILTTLFSLCDNGPVAILNALLSVKNQTIVNWININYPRFTNLKKALLFLCVGQHYKSQLLRFERSPEVLANIFVNIISLTKFLDVNTSLEFLNYFYDIDNLFSFLAEIKCPKSATVLFLSLCTYRIDDITFNIDSSNERERNHKILIDFVSLVIPTQYLMNRINRETVYILCSNVPLKIETPYCNFDDEVLPTLQSLIGNLKMADPNTIFSYQSALQKVPSVLIALAFFSPDFKNDIYTLFSLLSDEQMTTLASIVELDEIPNFLEKNEKNFDQYYEALPPVVLRNILTLMQGKIKEGWLLEQSLAIKELFQKLKPVYEQLSNDSNSDWTNYQANYLILTGLRSTFTKELSSMIFLYGRYERIARHINYQSPFEGTRDRFEAYRKEFCDPTSPTFFDTSLIRPQFKDDD